MRDLNLGIPRHLRDYIDRELDDDERIVWVDMPIPRFFTKGSLAAFLFAIPWTAFAVFWICGASGFKFPDFKEGSDFFPLFGIPFVLIGLGMLSTPIWTYRAALKTIYAITDKRAITVTGFFSRTVRSYLPNQLGDITRRENRNGIGDLVFDRQVSYHNEGRTSIKELGFLGVRNPREVEKLLRELAEQVG